MPDEPYPEDVGCQGCGWHGPWKELTDDDRCPVCGCIGWVWCEPNECPHCLCDNYAVETGCPECGFGSPERPKKRRKKRRRRTHHA